MKKALSLALALLMVFSMSVTAHAAPVRADDQSAANQLNIIFSQLPNLQQNEANGTWYYTVTDLDHNGRLEILGASLQSDGMTTLVKCWEIDETLQSLKERTVNVPQDESFPDLIADNADTYYDSSNDTWSYIFYDSIPLSREEAYYAKCAVSLKNGSLGFTQLALQHIEAVNGLVTTSYSYNNGTVISAEQYNDAKINSDAELIKSSTNLDWFTMSEAGDVSRLATSYGISKGTFQPEKIQPAAAPAADVQTYSAPAYIMVTKNPTNESHPAGETAWFVANATNWTSLGWTFVSPSGGEFTVQSFRNSFPGCSVSGESSTMLTISNLNTGMSGWGAYCTFYNNGQTARSNTAYLYVTEKPITVNNAPAYNPAEYVNCPNCGNRVSIYASKCPFCGFDPNSYSWGLPQYYNTYSIGGTYIVEDNYGTTTVYNDGDDYFRVFYNDGSYSEVYSDGSSIAHGKDGTYMVFGKDDSFVSAGYENSDGTYTEVYNDKYGWGSLYW